MLHFFMTESIGSPGMHPPKKRFKLLCIPTEPVPMQHPLTVDAKDIGIVYGVAAVDKSRAFTESKHVC